MADAQTDIQLVLRAIDQASGPIRQVQSALDQLASLNLSGTVTQLEGVGRGLDQLASQATAFAERFDATMAAVKASVAAQTAEVIAQTGQQRQALSEHAQCDLLGEKGLMGGGFELEKHATW